MPLPSALAAGPLDGLPILLILQMPPPLAVCAQWAGDDLMTREGIP